MRAQTWENRGVFTLGNGNRELAGNWPHWSTANFHPPGKKLRSRLFFAVSVIRDRFVDLAGVSEGLPGISKPFGVVSKGLFGASQGLSGTSGGLSAAIEGLFGTMEA